MVPWCSGEPQALPLYIAYMNIYIYTHICDISNIYIILLQSLFVQQHVLFQGKTTLPRISAMLKNRRPQELAPFLVASTAKPQEGTEPRLGAIFTDLFFHTSWGKNGEKIGKKIGKKWEKLLYLDTLIFSYIFIMKIYIPIAFCDEKDWNHGMEWGSKSWTCLNQLLQQPRLLCGRLFRHRTIALHLQNLFISVLKLR